MENDEWQVHATCMELGADARYAFRIPLMANQIQVLFGEEPQNLERFARMSQASQAEAMKFFVERFRHGKWARTGIIWWNLLDGWPQFSDAVIDYYYARKLAFYIIKRSQQPVCLMMREPENGMMTLVGANEYREAKELSYRVYDLADQTVVAQGKTLLAGNCASEICKILEKTDKLHFFLMEWEADGVQGKNYYVQAKAPYDFDEYDRYMQESGMWEADGF
jgi:beta-mannosidase